MKVILNEHMEHLGKAGEIVDVADGYARNYLIPQGKAVLATTRSVKTLEHAKRQVQAQLLRERKTAEAMKAVIEKTSVNIVREAGEEEKLFGSVTNRDIAEALAAEGIVVDHRVILLENPIKTLGSFKVEVKLTTEVRAEVKVRVVAK
ncbi:MAG TPA: 50S ribosomal protein L9 [Myxococcota bacterium]|nr:50S ribosomal protein L9 [Myxococcota bacterium]HOA12698.1 50S ribosomal protein L9 [Myxococcota bacterium]HOH76136.1 50S ribosomal protein L9 [Myxococcota bacterium]HPV03630.1 50S ribosomal protein L9 [Myxococcota bacterium]